MLRRKQGVFAPTDGILLVCSDGDRRTDRGSDFSDPGLLSPDLRLDYRRMRESRRDVELADATGVELSAKCEVRRAPQLTPELDAVLGGRVYEITRVEDRGRTCWLWLSEIACDGTCLLVSRSTARDAHGIPTGTDGGVEVFCRRVAPSATRATAEGVDTLRPRLRLRLRASDYYGETTVIRDGVTYTVTGASNAGRWVDLVCERKVADR